MVEVFFWVAIFLIFYSYLFYPFLLKRLAKNKKPENHPPSFEPNVSVIIPAYNEALLIEQKIQSICVGNYPLSKIEIIVYSDGSDDETVNLVKNLSFSYPFIWLIEGTERIGKSFAINQMISKAKFDIILLTDANIIFNDDTIKNNVKNYRHQQIGLVGSYVINPPKTNNTHSNQEQEYVTWENEIKYNEGVIWGCTIAPFGACFSFRKELFNPIPKNFLVDDFFIAATVLQSNFNCILEKTSVCFEELNGFLSAEMNRRKRISSGNFQNLGYFFSLFLNIFKPVGFCFWSHKGIRWFTPFLLFFLLIGNLYLLDQAIIYKITLAFQLFFYCTPLTYRLTKAIKPLHKIIKFAHYFLMMNFSLFAGFYQYIKGVKVGYWAITQRVK
jgi:cellulose synthase/poly-beta-1,6-N-acetylglucosamine synthase-like glycosyltransferase